jgi:hypothetical protein
MLSAIFRRRIMQWFKSAMVVSSVAIFAAAFAVEGCSSKATPDDGGADVKAADGKAPTDGKAPGDGGNNTCTSGLSCETCDVTGFSVSPQAKPIGPKSGACTSAQLTAFDTACAATSSTQATCSTWETANAGCSACIVTDQTAASWGPLVCTQAGCSINVPGCIDLALAETGTENGTNGSCGDLLNASYECQDYACGACDVAADGGSDPASFQTCDNAALMAECKSYSDAFDSSSQCSALQGDTIPTAVQVCFASDPNSGFSEQEVVNIAAFFCGPAN